MNSLMSPSDIQWLVYVWMQDATYYVTCYAAYEDVYEDVYDVVYEDVARAVQRAVHDAAHDALWQVLPNHLLHPNIDKFIEETEQNWSVA